MRKCFKIELDTAAVNINVGGSPFSNTAINKIKTGLNSWRIERYKMPKKENFTIWCLLFKNSQFKLFCGIYRTQVTFPTISTNGYRPSCGINFCHYSSNNQLVSTKPISNVIFRIIYIFLVVDIVMQKQSKDGVWWSKCHFTNVLWMYFYDVS